MPITQYFTEVSMNSIDTYIFCVIQNSLTIFFSFSKSWHDYEHSLCCDNIGSFVSFRSDGYHYAIGQELVDWRIISVRSSLVCLLTASNLRSP